MGLPRCWLWGILSPMTKPTELAFILTEQNRLQNLWSLFFLCGKYWRNQRQERHSRWIFLAKEKTVLAANEVIWILNCICRACWERKSSCETQSRTEPDYRTEHGHSSVVHCPHSSWSEDIWVFNLKVKTSFPLSVHHLHLLCASSFYFYIPLPQTGKGNSLVWTKSRTESTVSHISSFP